MDVGNISQRKSKALMVVTTKEKTTSGANTHSTRGSEVRALYGFYERAAYGLAHIHANARRFMRDLH